MKSALVATLMLLLGAHLLFAGEARAAARGDKFSQPSSPTPVATPTQPHQEEGAPASPTRETLPPPGSLSAFVNMVKGGQANRVAGVYVRNLFALRVRQQPVGNPAYVYQAADYVTQFSLAAQYGTIGLLAHNTLAGNRFSALVPGSVLYVIFGDGSVRSFRVYEVLAFRALSPYDVLSTFVELGSSGRTVSAQELFSRIYGNGGELVLQTCIWGNASPVWGRLFVKARPE